MKYAVLILRSLFGLMFVVFSLNYFVPFMPAQPTPPPEALAFVTALSSAKLLTLVKVVELVAGAALLADRFTPLALALLAPIVVGILGFHATLAPDGTGMSVVLVLVLGFLAYAYRAAYLPMLRARPATSAAGEASGVRAVAA